MSADRDASISRRKSNAPRERSPNVGASARGLLVHAALVQGGTHAHHAPEMPTEDAVEDRARGSPATLDARGRVIVRCGGGPDREGRDNEQSDYRRNSHDLSSFVNEYAGGAALYLHGVARAVSPDPVRAVPPRDPLPERQ